MSKLISFITIDEFELLLKAEKKKEYRLAYVLGFGSGLRISEILGFACKNGRTIPPLSQEQVNLQTHQIRVNGGKGNKDRITVTSKWLNEAAVKMLPLNIPRSTLQHRIKSVAKKALGKEIHFHTLRHGFANFIVNDSGVPLPMAQQLLGHSRLDTTGIYTKANPVKTIERAWEVWK